MIEYGFYEDKYLGSKIPRENLPFYVQKAEIYLKAIAPLAFKNRDRNDVKMTLCAISDILYIDESEGIGNGVASESNDGVSITYSLPKTTAQKISDVIRLYLSGTGFLYRGGTIRC